MPGETKRKIVVGFTEYHGMSAEQSSYHSDDVLYKFLRVKRYGSKILRSPIKGYFSSFDTECCDLVESVISPIVTNKPWVYSLAVIQEAIAFNILGLPTPRFLRIAYMKHLLLKNNCKKLVFWSHAGKDTISKYGKLDIETLHSKSQVVYPAIRESGVDLEKKFNKGREVRILFSGPFFRKGGVNVIDAFEGAQKKYRNISLRLCCSEQDDFYTENTALRQRYLKRIKSNPKIQLGRVSREEMINQILPNTDIYLLPTYQEAFGFAVLEAMAFGIPVITTNYMALPEIIKNHESGFLIDISHFDVDKLFKGYVVDKIPEEFHQYLSTHLEDLLCALIDSEKLRMDMGRCGINIASEKFSFETRNKVMNCIYQEALEN